MLAEIITIGDEILIGQIVDTNSAYIAKELNKIGVSVYQITSVQDDRTHILTALREAESRVQMVILTGGLGPTKDDITKHTLCEYFNDELILDNAVLEHVKELFAKYIKAPMSDLNIQQAMVPSCAKVLKNQFGTAPGMWMEQNGKVFISLPGVPFEMKALMQTEVLPGLQKTFNRPFILHKTILTYGMGESALAERIATWEDHLPSFIKLAYLPNFGKVRLRLTAKGKEKEVLEEAVAQQVKELYALIGDIIYGEEEEDSIETLIGKLLVQKKQTLATAESCTGGKIAESITAIPGASAYFKGGVVSYATEIKTSVLGVPEALIKEHSVVSEAVARSMAVGAQKVLGADYAVATTGNAGPSKGDSDAEVGTVWIAVATPTEVVAAQFSFGNHRDRVIGKAVNQAFEMLRKEILKN